VQATLHRSEVENLDVLISAPRLFGAEIELYLGEELEKHVITCSTVVYVPKDLPHCPLNFKVIEQPIVFMAIILGNKYVKKPIPKK